MLFLIAVQPDENTCISRVEVSVSEALRVVATAMCTRLASSADFKVLRAALARRRPRAEGGAGDAEDDAAASDDDAAAADDDDDDDRGSISAAAMRSRRASAPGTPAPPLPSGSRAATTTADDVDVEFPEGDAVADVTVTAALGSGAATAALSPRPAAVDGAAVARISQQIPRAVAVALGLVPGTAANKSRGSASALSASQLPSPTGDDDDLPLDAAGILSPALFEALELLVPAASVAPGGGASRGSDDPAPSAGLPAPTQGGLSAALRGLAESAIIRGAMTGVRAVISNAFAAATAYAASFQQYRQLVVTDVQTLRRLTKPLLAAQPVATIGAAMTALTAQVALCEDAPESRAISQLLRVESAQLKTAVRPAPRACLDALAHLLPQVAMERAATLLTELMAANSRLRVDFRSVDEYVSLTTALQDIQVRIREG